MALALAVFLWLIPGSAWAFGPITHVDLGLEVLAQAGVLAAAISRLIRNRSQAFLLGTLGPDRVVAKNLVPYARHSHNWERIFRLLAETRDEEERAALLGYLCHLAADAVAHNFFVPSKLAESWRFAIARHTYWEMRLDGRVRNGARTIVLKRLGFDDPEHYRFLSRVIPPTWLGTRVNAELTGMALRVQDGPAFDRLERFLDRRSALPLTDAESADVRRLAIAAQMDALERLQLAPVTGLDPRGLRALREAAALRRQIRRGGQSDDVIAATLRSARRQFREAVEALAPGAACGRTG